ncbi:MAG: hypothetical protein A3J93_01340 [Candidatus Magasanikbacteria bacterium RIFOXYC2_FULL_42_28]|uniref:Glycosyl transferase family 1 n=1 Tax=Candidatus Magasanikbacteria bacterium RIFOXYC2_FULL_42_28 TaxID=1798704 RepID=A0A1F6NXR3_9BACT|nr:MAG: hypothetical protein A3J93_01340 [Candidatus Magasanikbacteria bacterium RIFOXYC2_FULL_42_28]
MKILMIGQKGIPARYGGVERHVEELSYELAKLGHEIFVYARSWYTPKNIKNYRGINIIHTPSIHTKHLDAITHTLTSTLHALFQKPDVIHYHGVGPALLSWIPRLFLPNTKVVATFHCIDRYHQKWNFLARFALRVGEWFTCHIPHATIAVSESLRNYCLNEHLCHTRYIPNGARPIVDKSSELLNQFGLKPEKYLLMVARLVRHKGAQYLISAWKNARALESELLADYKLAIVGDSVFTDDYVKELHTLANNYKSIIFAGWVDGKNLEALFANTALLVHPSENEGLPLTVLSAMAAGRPVLVSDIAEHLELIKDKNFLFANTNIDELTERIIALIKAPELRREQGAKNAERAQAHYDWAKIARQTENIYLAKSHALAPARISTASK